MRVAEIQRENNPYAYFADLRYLPFWAGSLTLIGAAPGIGKTSWLLSMTADAAALNIPSALACYEHTQEELFYRLKKQAAAEVHGVHYALPSNNHDNSDVEFRLARYANALFLSLDDREDTIYAIEKTLLEYGFPEYGRAFLAVDYLQRIPVVGSYGLIPSDIRPGEAAAALRKMARKHQWSLAVAAAVSLQDARKLSLDLSSILGDERVPYEADRIVMLQRNKPLPCGCCHDVTVQVVKDRTDKTRTFQAKFWGEYFYLYV